MRVDLLWQINTSSKRSVKYLPSYNNGVQFHRQTYQLVASNQGRTIVLRIMNKDLLHGVPIKQYKYR